MDGTLIRTFSASESSSVWQAATILVEEFRLLSPYAWPTHQKAVEEVEECLNPAWIALAVFKGADMLAWAGARPAYGIITWELHPMAVHAAYQKKGIGTALLLALEEEVKRRGGRSMYLGTDDEAGRTSLSGMDLYASIPDAIAGIRNTGRHPYEFYLHNGYAVVGLIPDANGPGKPDIIMAKRLL
jgi:aminoglycoside 6'-N-acetyltransferase I